MSYSKSLTILLLFAKLVLYGQETTKTVYYKNSNGEVISEQEIEATMKETTERFQKMGLIAFKEFINKEEKEDSLIYEFHIQIIDSASYKEYDAKKAQKERLIGKPLPDFELMDLNDKAVRVQDFKGKPTVINLWFTACAPCIVEIPELNKIKELPEYAEVNFIAITFDQKDKVIEFLNKKKYNFTHIVNARQFCDYFTTSFPLNIFVDKNGIVTELQDAMPVIIEDGIEFGDLKVDSKNFIQALNKIK
ncbi:MAG: TlpA family protein disulfide reductase [Bacteroidales bacterium]|nr:TlpA family protein disulfide reductase [Bacteroidales bacterium]